MVNNVKNTERLLSTKEAATFLGMSTQWLMTDRYKSKHWGTPPVVPYMRLGSRTIRYRLSDLRALISDDSFN